MRYGKLDSNGVLLQVQPYDEPGFVLVPDDAVPGMITTDGVTFTVQPKTPEQLAAEKDVEARRRLAEIDLASIRAIRAYLAAKLDAPAELKTLEAEATELRKAIRRKV
jgi:hypothetical protein